MTISRRRVLAVLATVVLAGCGNAAGAGRRANSPAPSSSGPTSNASAHPRTPAPSSGGSSRTAQDAVTAFTRAVDARPAGSVSVAAVNLATGAQVSAGSTGGQWMASTYKLFLTEALLATTGSVDGADATAAIEHSDNAAGYRLFTALGGTSATLAAFRRFGLTHTTLPGDAYDPTFTTTSATDWIRILRNLVGPGQLTAAQRAYVLSLMKQVEPDQRWGVGAAATGSFVNKNGWETVDSTNTPPEPSDGGLWIVNSVGIVTRDGQQLLMAVLTQHDPAFDTGITLVQQLATLAATAVTS